MATSSLKKKLGSCSIPLTDDKVDSSLLVNPPIREPAFFAFGDTFDNLYGTAALDSIINNHHDQTGKIEKLSALPTLSGPNQWNHFENVFVKTHKLKIDTMISGTLNIENSVNTIKSFMLEISSQFFQIIFRFRWFLSRVKVLQRWIHFCQKIRTASITIMLEAWKKEEAAAHFRHISDQMQRGSTDYAAMRNVNQDAFPKFATVPDSVKLSVVTAFYWKKRISFVKRFYKFLQQRVTLRKELRSLKESHQTLSSTLTRVTEFTTETNFRKELNVKELIELTTAQLKDMALKIPSFSFCNVQIVELIRVHQNFVTSSSMVTTAPLPFRYLSTYLVSDQQYNQTISSARDLRSRRRSSATDGNNNNSSSSPLTPLAVCVEDFPSCSISTSSATDVSVLSPVQPNLPVLSSVSHVASVSPMKRQTMYKQRQQFSPALLLSPIPASALSNIKHLDHPPSSPSASANFPMSPPPPMSLFSKKGVPGHNTGNLSPKILQIPGSPSSERSSLQVTDSSQTTRSRSKTLANAMPQILSTDKTSNSRSSTPPFIAPSSQGASFASNKNCHISPMTSSPVDATVVSPTVLKDLRSCRAEARRSFKLSMKQQPQQQQHSDNSTTTTATPNGSRQQQRVVLPGVGIHSSGPSL